MDVNLAPLLLEQAKLDARINREHEVTHQNTKTERFLALLVEIGELANATRAFKYWSLKPSEDRAILLDEYADGLHFFLSLALVFNIDVTTVSYRASGTSKADVVALFKKAYTTIVDFMKDETSVSYFLALKTFLTLGSALQFSSDDITAAYRAKLVVNYERQNTKY